MPCQFISIFVVNGQIYTHPGKLKMFTRSQSNSCYTYINVCFLNLSELGSQG